MVLSKYLLRRIVLVSLALGLLWFSLMHLRSCSSSEPELGRPLEILERIDHESRFLLQPYINESAETLLLEIQIESYEHQEILGLDFLNSVLIDANGEKMLMPTELIMLEDAEYLRKARLRFSYSGFSVIPLKVLLFVGVEEMEFVWD